MGKYYYSSNKENWNGGLTLIGLVLKLAKGEINKDTIWYPALKK